MMSKRNKILTPPAFHLSDMKLRILEDCKKLFNQFMYVKNTF